jgi:CHAD domain-containing protein
MGKKRKGRGKRRPEVAAVASAVLVGQVAEARAHVAGAIDGSDPEELHDLRVAVRRMRAALRLFERALPAADAALDPARAGLKETGAILGRARDLDVQIERLRAWVASTERLGDPAAARAVGLLDKDRRIARLALRRHLRGAVFARRMALVEVAAQAALAAPARRTAPRLLRRPSKQVLMAVARARASPAEPTVFHALRIDVKRLRYALEFLEPSLPFSPRRLLRRLRAAQEALGALQDAAVEQALADRLIARAATDDAVRNLLELYKRSQADVQQGQLLACASMLDDLERDVRGLRGRL